MDQHTLFRFGIMGAGNIASHFCKAVELIDNCTVAAVASRSLDKAAAFAEANNPAAKGSTMKAYVSYEEMLQNEALDCVYIATVPSTHYELSKLCLNYRVPVLCEKQFFLSSAEAEEIFNLSKEKHVFVMEAMWSRFLPANKKALEWIHGGEIGKIEEIEIKIGWQPGPGSRQFQKELGGGAMTDLTVYGYELADFYMEKEEESSDVYALYRDGVDIIDHVTLHYKDACAVLSGSIVSAYEEAAILYGEEGKIIVYQPHMAKKAALFPKEGEPVYFEDTITGHGFVYEIMETMNCIQKGQIESDIVPHDLTLRCSKLMDRIREKEQQQEYECKLSCISK